MDQHWKSHQLLLMQQLLMRTLEPLILAFDQALTDLVSNTAMHEVKNSSVCLAYAHLTSKCSHTSISGMVVRPWHRNIHKRPSGHRTSDCRRVPRYAIGVFEGGAEGQGTNKLSVLDILTYAGYADRDMAFDLDPNEMFSRKQEWRN